MADKAFIPKPHELAGILAGRQSQFRRVLKPQPEQQPNGLWHVAGVGGGVLNAAEEDIAALAVDYAPYAVGDRLVVKETWQQSGVYWPRTGKGLGRLHYKATDDGAWKSYWGRWRSPATMPRWASRITLTVTEVRCQRVQEISEADAIAEGVEPLRPGTMVNPQGLIGGSLVLDRYARLWDSLHGPDAWQRNDWVFAYTFTTTRANVDALETAA